MVTLPTPPEGREWYRVADTSIEADDSIVLKGRAEELSSRGRYVVPSGAMVILMAK